MFVYLTHDIDFASTRNAKKCWLKSYRYDLFDEWDVEPINDNEIPEELLMKILGSRKRILFCEGKRNSLDKQIFEVLFPDYTITPVDSCKDVINYTRAFNKIKNKHARAYGIIDRDFRVQEQIDKLKTENIYAYNVAEIENLFMIEDFLKGFVKHKNEICDIEDIKAKVLNKLSMDVEQQVSYYVSQRINYYFNESHVKIDNTKDGMNKCFTEFINHVKIDEWYNDRSKLLTDIIQEKNYQEAILVYNNKGLHSIVEQILGMKPFNKKALTYLKSSEDARKILLSVFPNELTAV